MPRRRHTRILAIDPGTRETGIAVLEGDELLYHGVHPIPKGDSPHDRLTEGRRLVVRLLQDFKPEVLAVEKAFFANNRNAALLNVFVDEIQALGKRRKLKVLAFAPSTVKKAVCGNGWASKEEVAKAVIAKYPKLRAYLTREPQWKARYHGNMFDAVAIALTAAGELEDRK